MPRQNLGALCAAPHNHPKLDDRVDDNFIVSGTDKKNLHILCEDNIQENNLDSSC